MWLAHALTLSRVPLALAFWAVYPLGVWPPVLVVTIAAVTDGLDGWVARRVSPHGSSIGGWLDPLADKVFVVIALLAVYVEQRPAPALIALAGARELVMAPLALGYGVAVGLGRARARPLRAGTLGKIATVAQFLAVLALVADAPGAAWPLAAVAGVTGVAAVGHYGVRALRG